MRRRRAVEIRPGGGNAQACAIGEYEDELEGALERDGAEERERLPVEGMAGSPDCHPLGISARILVVGIVVV